MTLTATQTAVLTAAAEHPQGHVVHFPESVKGGARAKVFAGLMSRGLIEPGETHQRITAAGYAALGREAPAPRDSAKGGRRRREHTKQALMVALLSRAAGASLEQLVEATGWQPHSVRGALSLLPKKANVTVRSQKEAGVRIYRAE